MRVGSNKSKCIIIYNAEVREKWEESFQLMAKNKDGYLLDLDSIEHFGDEEEWKW